MEPKQTEITIFYDPTKGVPATSQDLRQAIMDVEAILDEIEATMDGSARTIHQPSRPALSTHESPQTALKQLKQEKEMWELWLSIADNLQG